MLRGWAGLGWAGAVPGSDIVIFHRMRSLRWRKRLSFSRASWRTRRRSTGRRPRPGNRRRRNSRSRSVSWWNARPKPGRASKNRPMPSKDSKNSSKWFRYDNVVWFKALQVTLPSSFVPLLSLRLSQLKLSIDWSLYLKRLHYTYRGSKFALPSNIVHYIILYGF